MRPKKPAAPRTGRRSHWALQSTDRQVRRRQPKQRRQITTKEQDREFPQQKKCQWTIGVQPNGPVQAQIQDQGPTVTAFGLLKSLTDRITQKALQKPQLQHCVIHVFTLFFALIITLLLLAITSLLPYLHQAEMSSYHTFEQLPAAELGPNVNLDAAPANAEQP